MFASTLASLNDVAGSSSLGISPHGFCAAARLVALSDLPVDPPPTNPDKQPMKQPARRTDPNSRHCIVSPKLTRRTEAETVTSLDSPDVGS